MRNGGENACQRVDFTQEVLGREAASPSCSGGGVRRRGHRHPRARRVGKAFGRSAWCCRVVEFEFVDADHGVVAEQVDALHEPEHAGQLRQLTEGGERPRVLGRVGQPPVRRASRWVLPTPNPPSRYRPTPGSCSLAEKLPSSRPGGTASSQSPGMTARPRTGWVRRDQDGSSKADVGESGRWNELGDQPLRRHSGCRSTRCPAMSFSYVKPLPVGKRFGGFGGRCGGGRTRLGLGDVWGSAGPRGWSRLQRVGDGSRSAQGLPSMRIWVTAMRCRAALSWRLPERIIGPAGGVARPHRDRRHPRGGRRPLRF